MYRNLRSAGHEQSVKNGNGLFMYQNLRSAGHEKSVQIKTNVEYLYCFKNT